MRRAIVEFRQDDEGKWAARLSCLHGQHIRHNPPFQLAPWVLDEAARDGRIGTDLECPLCDRAELPGELEVVGRASGDSGTLPAGTWGVLRVEHGTVGLAATPLDAQVTAGQTHAIPPELAYRIEAMTDDARYDLELLRRAE